MQRLKAATGSWRASKPKTLGKRQLFFNLYFVIIICFIKCQRWHSVNWILFCMVTFVHRKALTFNRHFTLLRLIWDRGPSPHPGFSRSLGSEQIIGLLDREVSVVCSTEQLWHEESTDQHKLFNTQPLWECTTVHVIFRHKSYLSVLKLSAQKDFASVQHPLYCT